MPRIFVHNLTVTEDAIDEMRHVNNLNYLAWMQDVAILHSTAQGWSMERYFASGCGWVVRSHSITYMRPAHLGDELALLTWVAGFATGSSRRRYLFWRPADQKVVAKAETLWVYVRIKSGQPRPVPDDLRGAFEIVEDSDEPLAFARALPVPGQPAAGDSL